MLRAGEEKPSLEFGFDTVVGAGRLGVVVEVAMQFSLHFFNGIACFFRGFKISNNFSLSIDPNTAFVWLGWQVTTANTLVSGSVVFSNLSVLTVLLVRSQSQVDYSIVCCVTIYMVNMH